MMEGITEDLQPETYVLSPLDVIPSHLYISNVLFFANPDSLRGDFMPTDHLRKSMRTALKSFPILLGRIRREGTSMSIKVDPNDPNVPSLEEIRSSVGYDEIRKAGYHRDAWPEGVNVLDPRVNPSGTSISPSCKLLRIRIVRLAGDSGVVMVIRLAHCVFDAKGCTQFLQFWANECAGLKNRKNLKTMEKPLMDRRAMFDCLPADLRPAARGAWHPVSLLLALLSLIARLMLEVFVLFSKKQAAPDNISSHLFRIQPSLIARVQASAQALSPTTPVSTNDVLVALFTMAFLQATTTPTQPTPKSISAIVPCDFRHRLSVPESYSGSCAIGLYVTCPTDLLALPITPESLARIALLSRQSVTDVSRPFIEAFVRRALRAITLLGHRANVLYALMVCQAFSNQSRLGWYDIDFGAGRAAFVVPVAYSNTVAVIMPGVPGGMEGAADVFLTLRPGVMERVLGNEGLRGCLDVVY